MISPREETGLSDPIKEAGERMNDYGLGGHALRPVLQAECFL